MKHLLYFLTLAFLNVTATYASHDEAARNASNAALKNAEKYEQEVSQFLDELANGGSSPKPQGSFFFSDGDDEKENSPEPDAQNPYGTVQSNIPLPSFKKGEACNGKCSAQTLQEMRSFRAQGPSQVLVFASFSMPDESLKALSDQARRSGCRLIMRGLLENFFQKTQKRAFELGIHYEIDPNLFEEFDVKSVPTFIHARVEKGILTPKGHDRLSGNVSLAYALEELSKNGTLQGSGEALKKLRRR